MTQDPGDVEDVEAHLLRCLTWWAGASTGVGGALWWVGARCERDGVRSFGRQHVMWGAVDAGIVAVGRLRGAARSPGHAQRLRRALRVNAVLDAGYVAAGITMIAARDRIAGKARISAVEAAGNGAAIAVQGAALLVIDAVHERRLAAASQVPRQGPSGGEPGADM